jgi:RNA polymerase sigma factor (sigma-70 family)
MLTDEEAEQFWVFYQKSSQALFRKAFRMCGGHRANAEDLHQRTYLKAMEHWDTLAGLADRQRHQWIITTLTREALQLWREPRWSREISSHDDIDWQPDTSGGDADDALVARDRYRGACRAIAQLGGRQGEVLALHCIAGYEMSEVAMMLEISQATTRVHLHAGRKRLLAIIAAGEEAADD